MPIIRRNNCIYATLGTCYSVWMTVWYEGGNSYRITGTNCHKNIVVSPDDGHIVARPKHVEKRNKHTKKTVHQVGFMYKNILLSQYAE